MSDELITTATTTTDVVYDVCPRHRECRPAGSYYCSVGPEDCQFCHELATATVAAEKLLPEFQAVLSLAATAAGGTSRAGVKPAESLADKCWCRPGKPRRAPQELKDLLRGQVVADAAGWPAAWATLFAAGFDPVETDSHWPSPAGIRLVNTVWRRGGLLMEVQFLVPEMYQAKRGGGQAAYKAARALGQPGYFPGYALAWEAYLQRVR